MTNIVIAVNKNPKTIKGIKNDQRAPPYVLETHS